VQALVSLTTFLLSLISLSFIQLGVLHSFKNRLHPVTRKVFLFGHSGFALLLILILALIRAGRYELVPDSIRLLFLFALFILPGFLLLMQAGSFGYAMLNRKFPYMFLEYSNHGFYYVTRLQYSRNGQLKQIVVQWDDKTVVTIPVSDLINRAKHGGYEFESFRLDTKFSLLLRLDPSNSNHYVFFTDPTYTKLSDELSKQPSIAESERSGEESELLFPMTDHDYVLIVDTFVLFDYPSLLPLLEKHNSLVLSPKVFESFPYHKVRQPQYRQALSTINGVLQHSSRIRFGSSTPDEKPLPEQDEVGRLINIAMEEKDKGNTVYMLTTNNKLMLKCIHFQIPYVDAHKLMKIYNSVSNPVYHFTFLTSRSS
jgi:hypothetical protein